jgi:hypothetical protein
VQLNLSNNALVGPVPAGLLALPSLSLKGGQNRLTLPADIDQLEHLTSLDVANQVYFDRTGTLLSETMVTVSPSHEPRKQSWLASSGLLHHGP